MASRTPQAMIFALINQANPSLTRYLTPDNCAATAAIALSGDASGKNTSITVTGVSGHGFKDSATFKYNRLGLLDMLTAQGATGTLTAAGQATVADMLASFNTAAKSNLTIADLTNTASDPVTNFGGGYYGATLTPKAGHLFFNAGVQVQYKGTFATLKLTGSFAGTATNGTAYSSSLPITGGNGIYTNPRLLSGSLPPGFTLAISGSMLVLSGNPGTDPVTNTFVAAMDSDDGQTAQTVSQTILTNGGAMPTMASTWTTTASTGLTVANLNT